MSGLRAVHSIIRHRALVGAMVRRDLEARYRGSFLGTFWALLSPLAMIIIYAVFFGVFLQLRPGGGSGVADFGLFIMAGIVPWAAFSEALTRATSVVLHNSTLVKKVVFPLEILPVNVVAAALVGQVIGLIILALALLLLRGLAPFGLLLVPLLLVPQVLLMLGLTWLLASLGVFLRDLGQAIGLVMTGWMFLTPIFYTPAAVPENWRWLLLINPMAPLIMAYRAALLGDGSLDLPSLAGVALLAIAVCLAGGTWFMRTKHAFVDVL